MRILQEKLIEIHGLSKTFPGVTALKDVSFDVFKNTVHCIIGENGAGKSTLIKVLTGAMRRSSGKVLFKGREWSPRNTRDAMTNGMSMLFQELNVVDQLTVEQNLTLGREQSRFGFEMTDKKRLSSTVEVLLSMDPRIQLGRQVGTLSVAQKQVIEIAKAISSEADVIVMDEPTAAISDEEANRLFSIIRELRRKNVTVIYISHRLAEIFRIGDYVTVLRDGTMIGTRSVKEVYSSCKDEIEACAELIKMMLGKVVAERFVANPVDRGTAVLALDNIRTEKLDNISFQLHRSEILGFYGLVGAGKTEIARVIYGVDPWDGTIHVRGRIKHMASPSEAIRAGIAMVPEERRSEGLLAKLSIKENVSIMNMKPAMRFGFLSRARERRLARTYIEKLRIVSTGEEQNVSKLSGGNQQKVVLSKCLNTESEILLLDEPTRGIDVGAKAEIHDIIRSLARGGKSIIVFSSELPEILSLCDRIILMYEGRICGVVDNDNKIDSERIMHVVTGSETRVRGYKE